MKLEDLSPEKIEELAKLETPEDVFAFMKANLVELSDAEIELISGGRVLDAADADELAKRWPNFGDNPAEGGHLGEFLASSIGRTY